MAYLIMSSKGTYDAVCAAVLAVRPAHGSVQRPIPHVVLVARSGARVVLAQQHRLHLRFVQNLFDDAELRPPPRMVEIGPARADDFDNPRLNDRPTTVHARPPVDVHGRPLQRYACRRRLVDGVPLGMFNPMVFSGPLQALGRLCRAMHEIVARGHEHSAVRRRNDASHLFGIGTLGRHLLTELIHRGQMP